MKKLYIGLLIILTIFIFFALLVVNFIPSSNLRKFKTGNMSATGYLNDNKKGKFYSFYIGTPKEPFEHKKLFSIKLKNGKIIKSNDFLEVIIKEIAIYKKEKKADKNEWNVNVIEYGMEGYTFIYSKDKLLYFSATWIKLPDEIIKPKIGIFDAKEFFELPMKQSDLEKIFGKPDKEIDSFKW